MSTNPEEIPAGLRPAPAVDPATGQPVASNGHGPTLGANQQTALATQQTVQAIGALIQQVMGLQQLVAQLHRPRLYCATCLLARMKWQAAHADDIKQAIAVGRQAAGIGEGDPLPPGFDPIPFLAPPLRPGAPQGIPPVTFKTTTVGGTDFCAEHIPGAPGGQGSGLLIAHGSLTPSMLAPVPR